MVLCRVQMGTPRLLIIRGLTSPRLLDLMKGAATENAASLMLVRKADRARASLRVTEHFRRAKRVSGIRAISRPARARRRRRRAGFIVADLFLSLSKYSGSGL